MKATKPLVYLVVATLVVIGGYYAYSYAVQKPPRFLVQLFTKTDPPPPLPPGELAPLTVPEGFRITVFARDVPKARVMTRDPKGTMLVALAGDERSGKIVALPELDGDGKADRVVTVLSGLNQPHGIYVLCPSTGNVSADQDACTLYVAETDAITAYAYDADTMSATNPRKLVSLPGGGGHFTRTILPTPDLSAFYVSIGSSCNVCNETNPLRASIQRLSLETGTLTPIATGLRNSVFMATNPIDGELWATDNGRDLIGDDIPPDEVNIVRQGGDYGWPICYGKNVHDANFDDRQYLRDPCADKVPSHIDLPAHGAALGLAFVPEEGWPDEWGNDLLVALHGSWNRSTPAGYKVVRVDLDERSNQIGPIEDFVTGFLPAGTTDTDDAIGRPVALMAEPGGTLYISDDRQGAIYKVMLIEPPR